MNARRRVVQVCTVRWHEHGLARPTANGRPGVRDRQRAIGTYLASIPTQPPRQLTPFSQRSYVATWTIHEGILYLAEITSQAHAMLFADTRGPVVAPWFSGFIQGWSGDARKFWNDEVILEIGLGKVLREWVLDLRFVPDQTLKNCAYPYRPFCCRLCLRKAERVTANSRSAVKRRAKSARRVPLGVRCRQGSHRTCRTKLPSHTDTGELSVSERQGLSCANGKLNAAQALQIYN